MTALRWTGRSFRPSRRCWTAFGRRGGDAGLVQRLGELSLTTSVVLLPLLLLSGQLERRYRAEGRVLLWLLLALWLLQPVRWAPPEAAVLSLPAPQPAQVWGEGEPEDWRVPQAPASTPETPDPAWRWEEAVPWLWLAGCGGLLLWQSAGALLVRRRLLRGAEEKPEDRILLARLWHGEHGPPRVLRTEAAGPPLSLGLLRPVVVLPPDLAGEEAELVLRHELAHIRRHDLWAKALLNLANAAHWFNPLVWWMVRRAGRDWSCAVMTPWWRGRTPPSASATAGCCWPGPPGRRRAPGAPHP